MASTLDALSIVYLVEHVAMVFGILVLLACTIAVPQSAPTSRAPIIMASSASFLFYAALVGMAGVGMALVARRHVNVEFFREA